MKTVFIDRDGVINEDTGYVYKKQDFKFIEGALSRKKVILRQLIILV